MYINPLNGAFRNIFLEISENKSSFTEEKALKCIMAKTYYIEFGFEFFAC